MKNADPESRLVELLKAHSWNDAVKILKKEKREGSPKALPRVSEGSGSRRRGVEG